MLPLAAAGDLRGWGNISKYLGFRKDQKGPPLTVTDLITWLWWAEECLRFPCEIVISNPPSSHQKQWRRGLKEDWKKDNWRQSHMLLLINGYVCPLLQKDKKLVFLEREMRKFLNQPISETLRAWSLQMEPLSLCSFSCPSLKQEHSESYPWWPPHSTHSKAWWLPWRTGPGTCPGPGRDKPSSCWDPVTSLKIGCWRSARDWGESWASTLGSGRLQKGCLHTVTDLLRIVQVS